MEYLKTTRNKKSSLLIGLFVVFLFLRIFVDSTSSTLILASDNLKYLEASKNFPHHLLYNNQIYLLHPPFFPYVIHFFDVILGDDRLAAMMVSLLAAIVTFFAIYKFFMLLTKNFNITFIVLIFFTLSVPLIISATAVMKESLALMLIFLSLYYYVKGIKLDDKISILLSTIFGSLLAITVDHVIFLFPSFALSYLILNSKKPNLKKFIFPNLKYALIPVIFVLLFYGSWSYIKFSQYSSYDFYPNGLEGAPVDTKNLPLLAVLSPTFFDDFTEPLITPGLISFIKKLVFQFGYMFNIEPFSIPLGINFTTMKYLLFSHDVVLMFILYLPLAVIAAKGIFEITKDIINKKSIYGNINLYMVGIFLFFLFPITQKMTTPRFVYTSYVFFFYFIAYGFYSSFMKKKDSIPHSKFLALILILILTLPFWFYTHSTLFTSTDKFVSAYRTGEFIRNNIGEDKAIIAQQGYTAKVNYLTNNRVIGLYPDPKRLFEIIEYFDIDYLIFGKRYTYDAHHYSVETTDYVKSNPDKFELIATINEDYSKFYVEEDLASSDVVYIYKIKR